MKIDFSDAIFTGRGSTALWSILRALNRPNSGVMVPVNICEIIIPIIKHSGMMPVYYDVEKNTGLATLETIKSVYTNDITVLIAVHNFGVPVEIDEISEWAKDEGIFLIEDVCNALGATFKGQSLGTWGDASLYSFGYAKIIEYGVGGAAIIKNNSLREKVFELISSLPLYSDFYRNKDIEFQSKLREIRKFNHKNLFEIYNSLYDEYVYFLLYRINQETRDEILYQLNDLEENILKRKSKANIYRSKIKHPDIEHIAEVEGQTYWRYNLLVRKEVRQNLLDYLRYHEIWVSTWYPPIVRFFDQKVDNRLYPNSELFSKEVINLFVDEKTNQETISRTIYLINNFESRSLIVSENNT